MQRRFRILTGPDTCTGAEVVSWLHGDSKEKRLGPIKKEDRIKVTGTSSAQNPIQMRA